MSAQVTGTLILLGAMAVESVAQLGLKLGAGGGPALLRPACRRWVEQFRPATHPRFWIGFGVAAYVLEILLYTCALRFLDVSVAFPLGSLCFVGVALLSKFLLGEAVSPARWLGVGCILAGSCIVAL